MPICIAGMHRAGTSMVARLLEGCGLDLGGPAHFAPPAPDNRDGYWEDLRFVALNDRILDRLGGAWDHPPALPPGWEASPELEGERRDAADLVAGRAEPWGWKDPRTSLTFPFWKRLLPALKVVVCVRNPLEVADSLRARGYTSERFGLALWESYHRALDEAADGACALVTHYHSLLAAPRAELARLLEFTGLHPSPAVLESVLTASSSAARHQRRSSSEVESSPALGAAGKRMYAALCERSGPVYGEARRLEAEAAAAPAASGEPAERPRRSAAEQLQEVLAVLDAREMELASIKPALVARTEYLESVLSARAAQEEAARAHAASLQAVLGARDAEVASLHAALAEHAGELARTREALALRERQLRTVRGILGALAAALKRRLSRRVEASR